jgi:hypothetical protein
MGIFSVILQFAYIHLFLNQQIRFDIHVCKTVSILFEQMNKKFEISHQVGGPGGHIGYPIRIKVITLNQNLTIDILLCFVKF